MFKTMTGTMRFVLLLGLGCFFTISCSDEAAFFGTHSEFAAAFQEDESLDPADTMPNQNFSSTDPDLVLPPPPPAAAITKGSFTVWTEPEQPRPRQDYFIVVRVNLPPNIVDYPKTDLSGGIIGTDNYSRDIHSIARPAYILRDRFEAFGNYAELRAWVPGAEFLVKDTITIRSKMLDEEQTIYFVFQ